MNIHCEDSPFVMLRLTQAPMLGAVPTPKLDNRFNSDTIAAVDELVTPWAGDPRVNIQNDHGKAKSYQVRQVLAAIDRLQG